MPVRRGARAPTSTAGWQGLSPLLGAPRHRLALAQPESTPGDQDLERLPGSKCVWHQNREKKRGKDGVKQQNLNANSSLGGEQAAMCRMCQVFHQQEKSILPRERLASPWERGESG